MQKCTESAPIMDDRFGCVLSSCGRYRYRWRHAGLRGRGTVVWVMLNPSTADAARADPTVRRCMGYTRAWGLQVTEVCNLFALRSTRPRALYAHEDPIGPENDGHLLEAAAGADLVMCAWGSHGRHRGRAAQVLESLRRVCQPRVLRLTACGEPAHPLYLPKGLAPIPL